MNKTGAIVAMGVLAAGVCAVGTGWGAVGAPFAPTHWVESWCNVVAHIATTAPATTAPAPRGQAPAARGASAPASRANAIVVRPEAVLETEPVGSSGDAADDPAIWIHPTDPERSLLIGTDKRGGLEVYDLEGRRRQVVSDGSRPNNVDLLYGFALGDKAVDLAVASASGRDGVGVKVWRIDPATGQLTDLTPGAVLPVLVQVRPYGLCTYCSRKTGKAYFFVTSREGHVEQHLLSAGADGKLRAEKVRAWKLRSIAEGCVADEELGWVYVAEEQAGIWKFPAEPDGQTRGQLVARVGENGLTGDVEGLTLYCAAGGKGYLIASSQGSNTFKVYERGGDNRFVLTMDPKGGGVDDVSDTDGIAASSCATSKRFPAGMLIVQDGANDRGNQNFKVYDWRDIAAGRLLTGTDWSPRK